MPLIELSLGEDILPGEPRTSEVGLHGEKLAADHLRRLGYDLVVSNFKVPVGRNRNGAAVTGEIDLIAIEDGVLCFIEVKARSSDGFGGPLSAVDLRKQRQITRTARIYRRLFSIEGIKYRFDGVGIVFDDRRAPKITVVRGFWDESKFRRKSWMDEWM